MGGVLCRHIITIFYIKNKSYCKVDHTDLAKIKQLTQDVLIQMNKAVMKESGIHVQFQGDRESAILLSKSRKFQSVFRRCFKFSFGETFELTDSGRYSVKAINRFGWSEPFSVIISRNAPVIKADKNTDDKRLDISIGESEDNLGSIQSIEIYKSTDGRGRLRPRSL